MISHRHSRRSSAVALRACVTLSVMALATGYFSSSAGAQKGARDLSRTPVQTVWPLPPDEARVHYVAVYTGSDDVGAARKSKTLSLRETLLGKDRVSPQARNPNGFVKPFGVAVGRMGQAQYQYTLQGENLVEMNEWAPRLLQKLRSLPQLRDVNTDQQDKGLQASVIIDRDTAARLGVATSDIDAALYDAFGQRQVSIMYRSLNQYHVVMEVAPEFAHSTDALQSIYVRGKNGTAVPLASLAHFGPSNTSLAVNHQGQYPSVTISFNMAPGVSLGAATTVIEDAERSIRFPATIHAGFQGTAAAFQDSLSSEPILILCALLTVYIVLGILYESYAHPITILSTLPSAGVGALLALLISKNELNVIGLIGIILLIGIVKQNAIMMIDFALYTEREHGKSPTEAIREACLLRFRPIMMTTMAALLGGLPLALGTGTGSELRRPLGITIVGGLIVSQMLTLFTTPVVYIYIDRARLWLAGFRTRTRSGARPPVVPRPAQSQ